MLDWIIGHPFIGGAATAAAMLVAIHICATEMGVRAARRRRGTHTLAQLLAEPLDPIEKLKIDRRLELNEMSRQAGLRAIETCLQSVPKELHAAVEAHGVYTPEGVVIRLPGQPEVICSCERFYARRPRRWLRRAYWDFTQPNRHIADALIAGDESAGRNPSAACTRRSAPPEGTFKPIITPAPPPPGE